MSEYITDLAATDFYPGPVWKGGSGLGNVADDAWQAIRGLLDAASRGGLDYAGDLACRDEFHAAAAASIARRTGIEAAGRRYRELARQAQRHCTREGHLRAEAEGQESAYVTGAWVIAGMGAVGLALAVYFSLRGGARKNPRRGRRRRRSRRRTA